MSVRTLSVLAARRLAVVGQGLAGRRAADVAQAVRHLGLVQRDPVSAVAPSEHLVLFSRIGAGYARGDLDRACYADRSVVEYWVHLIPAGSLGCISRRCAVT